MYCSVIAYVTSSYLEPSPSQNQVNHQCIAVQNSTREFHSRFTQREFHHCIDRIVGLWKRTFYLLLIPSFTEQRRNGTGSWVKSSVMITLLSAPSSVVSTSSIIVITQELKEAEQYCISAKEFLCKCAYSSL